VDGRRGFLLGVAAGAAGIVLGRPARPALGQAASRPTVTVYKSPT